MNETDLLDSDSDSIYTKSSLSDVLNEKGNLDQYYLRYSYVESLTSINWVLKNIGLSERITKLSDCTVSMFIVLLEALFQIRIAGVHRFPKTQEDHLTNCQILLKTLSVDVVTSFFQTNYSDLSI
jgi:hypothetical protein